MNILTIGDIVGTAGVKRIKEVLPTIRKDYNIDFVICNAENAADGMGLTKKIYDELMDMKIDVITMGNHTWAKKDIFTFIDEEKLIRPINYSKNNPGKGSVIIQAKGKKIAVINAIGRASMAVLSDNPFSAVKDEVKRLKNIVDMIFVDFHAEATAEKIAMGYYLDGEITALFGTHTHVQTADEQILPNGTAYITDIGMTGPNYSVIGMNVDASIKRFETSLPEKYKVSDDKATLHGCVFEIDDISNKVTKIERIVK